MEWIALLIPIALCIAAWYFFHHKLHLVELISPVVLGTLLILLFKFIGGCAQTTDTEYWTNYGVRADYYEQWNEKVPCSHPKYRTVSTGRGRTTIVFAGFMHAYDVSHHPEYYEIIANDGTGFPISKQEFHSLQWEKAEKIDLHRSYHTIDGDKWTRQWNNSVDTMRILCSDHSYENRVQCSNSIFNFPKVSEEDLKKHKLYNYPKISNHFASSVLGHPNSRPIDILNAELGNAKEIKIWVLVYNDMPINSAYLQENYWKGSNKNELVICIGLLNDLVDWVHTFSWSDTKEVQISARDLIAFQKGKSLNLNDFSEKLKPIIVEKWKRKNFDDFSYIHVDQPTWSIIVTYILVTITSIGLLVFGIYNDLDPEYTSEMTPRRYKF